jgi:hypothetical protein
MTTHHAPVPSHAQVVPVEAAQRGPRVATFTVHDARPRSGTLASTSTSSTRPTPHSNGGRTRRASEDDNVRARRTATFQQRQRRLHLRRQRIAVNNHRRLAGNTHLPARRRPRTQPRRPDVNRSGQQPLTEWQSTHSAKLTGAMPLAPKRWWAGIRADVGSDRRRRAGPSGYREQRENSSDRDFAQIGCGSRTAALGMGTWAEIAPSSTTGAEHDGSSTRPDRVGELEDGRSA